MRLFDGANVALVIGLVLTAVATVAIVWAGNKKEEYLNRELSASRERTVALELQAEKSRADIARANADAAQSLSAAKQAEANLAGAKADAAKATARSDEAKAESAKSIAVATAAQLQLAQANERAARAEQNAAEAKLALEKFKAPRVLTKEQRDILLKSARKFAGTRLDVFMYGETPEIVDLTGSLTEVFISAGLVLKTWTVTGGGTASGVIFIVKKGSPPAVEKTAQSLAKELNELGIQTERQEPPVMWGDWTQPNGMWIGPVPDNKDIAPIRMVIGAKP